MRNNISDAALIHQVDFPISQPAKVVIDEALAYAEREAQMVRAVDNVSSLYRVWSRGLDVAFALVGIAALAFMLLLLAPLMLLDSPGPLFYRQQRVGYRGKTFCMIKLRSMRVNAETMGQPVWATKRDTRVTRIGRFLRATHLDELPQVINILQGEMSVVGPRPEREAYANELGQQHPEYCFRLLVKPGLTGLAQVNYGYGESSRSELEKLSFDLHYIQHRSMALDITILLKTVGEVVGGHGV